MHFVFFVTVDSLTKLKKLLKTFLQGSICPEACQMSTVYFPSDFKIASSGVERPLQMSVGTRFTCLISACAQL